MKMPPDRPSDKSHRKSREGQQGSRKRITAGEEKFVKDETGGTAVEEEIVSLQGGTEEAAEHGPAYGFVADPMRDRFSLLHRLVPP